MNPRFLAVATATLMLLGGCATVPQGKSDPRDPLERVNRSIYRFNSAADRAVLRPTARAWRAVVPQPLRRGAGNFIDNLAYPRTIVNDLLQGKLADGGQDLARLVVNTVVGFGFFDPATRIGLERHDEDFGQTLGKWGVPTGPYVMLPLLGPSSLRDTPAKFVDLYADTRHYITDNTVSWGLWAVGLINLRAQLLDTDAVIDQAYDPYALVRNAWLQRREYQVRDGDVAPGGDEDAPPPDEELPPDSAAPATP
jgi:phospholipid-binding lipoprotein MlaA